MKILSSIYDERISSTNVFVESTIGEYLSFANKIIDNNEMQRRRVKSSSTVYSLLKKDLKHGCVIPPLVLAVTDYSEINESDDSETAGRKLINYILQNTKNVMILDGLQRTYTMLAASEELKNDIEAKERYLSHKLRLEIYISINKFGILYRMLTLNTGQTPMSPRHQIEILYKSMLDTNVDGVKLVTETSGNRATKADTLRFKDAVEGFNSYMNRDELPIDRQDILENIKMLENLTMEDTKKDIFKEFVSSYSSFLARIEEIYGKEEISEDERIVYKLVSEPFAKTALGAFNISQALTGFGAATGRMKDYKIFESFEQLTSSYDKIKAGGEDNHQWFCELLVKFQSIKEYSKKIGNGQRMFFQYFFRELFNPASDSYLDLCKSVENGYQKYRSQI